MSRYVSLTKAYLSGESVFIVKENCTMNRLITHIFETEKEADEYKDFLLKNYVRN